MAQTKGQDMVYRMFEAIVSPPSVLRRNDQFSFLNVLFPGFSSTDLRWIQSAQNQISQLPEGNEWKLYILALGAILK